MTAIAAQVEIGAPAARAAGGSTVRTVLSLPDIHCAGCISTVERVLHATPGVSRARVNLSLRRVDVQATADVSEATLIGVLDGAGYKAMPLDTAMLGDGEDGGRMRDMVMRLGLAGFAAMNVMLLSVAVWSGAEAATRDLFHWISAGIALPVIAISGKPFLTSAWTALTRRRLNMDVPISAAILLAAALSLYETATSGAHVYFDAALSLVFFLLAGRVLDLHMRKVARSAARELAALEPQAVDVRVGDRVERRAAADVAKGDIVVVARGARAPVDGVVVAGETEIDMGILTGESRPVHAGAGANVPAGAMNMLAPVELRVTAAGGATSLARMAAAVAAAESGRAKYSALADRAAAIYAPLVHGLSLVAGIGWYVGTGDAHLAVSIAVAVLIITCPCALGLAVPAVSTAATGKLLRNGLLVKSETALERLAEVEHVIFDKTGTLTGGTLTLLDDGGADAAALSIALGLAAGSNHPVSRALVGELAARGIRAAAVTDLREMPGEGLRGRFDGQPVALTRPSSDDQSAEGPMAVLVLGDRTAATFRFRDTLREGAAELVAALMARGLTVELMSGDAEGPVRATAAAAGIDRFTARATPDDKLARVQTLQADGVKVLMVGDGLNDTAPLAAAHASIAPATALDAARAATDIVLLSPDLTRIATAQATAKLARRLILQNFLISAGYNMIAIPIALAGFATPLMAAIAMSSSSVTVSLNGARAGWR